MAKRRKTTKEDSISDLKGDWTNIFILSVLYTLQGVPIGLTAAIPLILQNQGASYTQQAGFSFVLWPFSLKILWAPIVDAFYIKGFGRRKTWVIPSQYLIGLLMLLLSSNVENWLGISNVEHEPQIMVLTVIFFMMNALAATQDIALDAWALSMLKDENKSYASTCNSAGQSAGFFLGYVVFIAFESASFCNNYLRSEPQDVGILTLPGFMFFWGVAFLIITTIICLLKSEKEEPLDSSTSILSSYHQLFKILCLPNVQFLTFILLTAKIGFAACDGITNLKLIDQGVPKEKLAILSIPLVPLQILFPILVANFHQDRGKPLNLYIQTMIYRLLFNFVAAFFVFVTPLLLGEGVPIYYYVLLFTMLAVQMSVQTVMFVQMMSFFAIISDPVSGGTYMALFNTLNNLGGSWSSTAALSLVDYASFKGGFDGYFVLTGLCTFLGFLWYNWGKNAIHKVQNEPLNSWKVKSRKVK